MHNIDLFVQNYFLTARTPVFTKLMIFLTSMFDVTDFANLVRFAVIILCVAGLVYWIRNKKFGKNLRPG